VYEKMQEEVKDVEEKVPSKAGEPLSSEPTHIQPLSIRTKRGSGDWK
jgi:hypothetical protein